LAKLTAPERVQYYQRVCHSIGLNPLTQPFEYITLNGKLRLYAKRDCADQLRKINGISVEIVSQEVADGLLTVHVRGTDRTGRKDEDVGVVPFPETVKGEARANLMLKAITKAKRRVTLSISGLGLLDESEAGSAADEIDEGAITDDQAKELSDLVLETKSDVDKFLKYIGAPSIADIPASKFAAAKAALEAKKAPAQ
jgi:hypothetical protein